MPATANSVSAVRSHSPAAGDTSAADSTRPPPPARASIASEALARFGALYAIEADIRSRSAEGRGRLRQEKAKPILATLMPWLEAQLSAVSQKSTMAEAIRYALARWRSLTRFLDDGRIEIDSNTVKRAIRPLALNRKNALFAGAGGGGEHWAILASLIETCKLNGVAPQAYLADVFTRLANGHPNIRIDELLPWAYAKTHPKAQVT